MKLLSALLLLAALAVASAPVSARVKYPSDKQLREMRNICAGGVVQSVDVEISSALKEWKAGRKTRSDTSAASKDLGAVLEKVTADAGGNSLYEKYVNCVREQVTSFLARANAPRAKPGPRARVERFFTAGVTYGSIRTDDNEILTNDNRMIGLARVGWRFNRHVAFGFEGSYWEAQARTVEFSGARVDLDRPLRHVASSVTVPLYLQLSDRFPLVVYFGAGMGWEAHDRVSLDASGGLQDRDRTKDSGLALVAGAGFEFPLSEGTSLALLARGIRTRIDSPSSMAFGTTAREPERTVLSFGIALSFN